MRHNKANVRFVQGDLFMNWFGHKEFDKSSVSVHATQRNDCVHYADRRDNTMRRK